MDTRVIVLASDETAAVIVVRDGVALAETEPAEACWELLLSLSSLLL